MKKAIPRIEKLTKAILEANELYNQGRISDAYVVFRKELNKLKKLLLYDRMTGLQSKKMDEKAHRGRP